MSIPSGHIPLHTGENPIFGRSMFFIGHIGMILGYIEMYKLGFSLQLLMLVLVGFFYEHLGGLGITAGAHRLWSHKAYHGNTLYRFIVMLFNCISFQGELLYWCRDHRVHHKYSDTRKDPHNATRGFWYSHMGWLLLPRDPQCVEALKEVADHDLLQDPVIQFQLKYYPILVLVLRVMIPTYIGYLITSSVYTGFCVLCCGFWTQSLHHTFLVNSAAHVEEWGYRPYDDKLLPNENPFVIYAAAGEGHHNFHHVFPRDYATSELDWTKTYNPTKWFIDTAARLGMIEWRCRNVYDQNKKRFVNKKIYGNDRVY
mmetsp:Transcript_63448/g.100929  ORF Transcript_63448/g.100929 Transcript_63448/m.100929 type:complete len:313 (+) Transcript_63448:1852-2790(+)